MCEPAGDGRGAGLCMTVPEHVEISAGHVEIEMGHYHAVTKASKENKMSQVAKRAAGKITAPSIRG